MNGLTSICAILLILLLAGGVIGLTNRHHFSPRWLFAAAALVLVNDALLTCFYWTLPDPLTGLERNWTGKILALVATLAIAAKLGWREAGLTLRQEPGSLRTALPVAALYCGFFSALSLLFPGGESTTEDLAFQLTMPGLEEELFYRGLLLLALDRAFGARLRFLGVDWGWSALLTSLLFGLAHSFSYGADGFSFDPLTMALTAIPSFIAVWVRLRTESMLLPVLMHDFGNSIFLLL